MAAWSFKYVPLAMQVKETSAGKGTGCLVSPSMGKRQQQNENLRTSFSGESVPAKRAVDIGSRQASKAFTCRAVSASWERKRRPENVDGDFFVDHTCIDCDTCRWMTPETFSRIGDMSAVHRQPDSKEERVRALQALLACPTASIHTEKPPKDIKEAQATFPIPIDEVDLPGVYHSGYHSEKSFGATSYFIVREQGGNVLVDSPRFTEQLAKRLEQLGGVDYLFMTHRDDIADHDRWAARFGCKRIFHMNEVGGSTRDVEMKLEGEGPWEVGPDISLFFTPGHTSGHVVLHYRQGVGALFTGDHLAYSTRVGALSIMRAYNWHSVAKQVESCRKLLPLDFLWLLPGHGRKYKFDSTADKMAKLKQLLEQEDSLLATSHK
eukprot:SM000270S10376  [mRNA]  locus=s270:96436:98730:- [translate_table: standard]